MLFNTWAFLCFFGGVFLVHRLLAHRARKLFLLGASWFFYASWNPLCLPLLWVSTLIDWWAARGIAEAETRGSRRLWLGLSLFVNLGLLAAFKYLPFFVETWTGLTRPELAGASTLAGVASSTLAGAAPLSWARLLLPVGISFYTLQTLSYTLDVYRGRLRPWPSFLDYALYVSFFPQLVAGPIVRGDEFLPQCRRDRAVGARELVWGGTLLIIGLFAKVVVADRLTAPLVESVFDSTKGPGFLDAWAATFAFSVQVFHDFFGYSTCAVGLAGMLGYRLPMNFHWPFASVGYGEFWRRWHVTLHSWLADYVYRPLRAHLPFRGGAELAIFGTFCLSGLWHGASWTFVLFGALQGLLVLSERLWRKRAAAAAVSCDMPAGAAPRDVPATAAPRDVPATAAPRDGMGVWFRRFWVFATAFGLAMPLFRAPSMKRCFEVWSAMFRPGWAGACRLLGRGACAWALILAFLVVCFHGRMGERSLEEVFAALPRWSRPLVLALMLLSTLSFLSLQEKAFVYFQF